MKFSRNPIQTLLATSMFSTFLRLGFVIAIILGLSVGPSGAVATEDGRVRDPVESLSETQLDNGLRVLLLEDHRTPVVAFQIWVNAGSSDESFHTGIAHLFEHMMFKGSKNIAPELHAQLINERGGRINAYTNRDVTVYHEDITAESLPLVIDLEAERFANLDISESTLESEREVVLEERRLRTEDSPDGRGFEALAALVWQAHPYRWPTIGWRSDVEQVTVEACQAFFDTYYAANNLTIVIVGDFDGESTLAHIKRTFGHLAPAEVIPRNPTTVVEQRGERRADVFFDVQIPLLYAGWHTPPSGHPMAKPSISLARFSLEADRAASTDRSSTKRRRLYMPMVAIWNTPTQDSSTRSPAHAQAFRLRRLSRSLWPRSTESRPTASMKKRSHEQSARWRSDW